MKDMQIPVSKPYIAKNSQKYVADALNRGDVSGLHGYYIGAFEERFAEFSGANYAVSCSSGTAALHLALICEEIGPGDEVLCSSTTNMATFFAIEYTGATPVPVDVEAGTFSINIEDAKSKITQATKGIVAVHLFGEPCNLKGLKDLCNEEGIFLVEDCAEAHGAVYEGVRVGSQSSAGCFSLFANKILNTGEGGMVTTNSQSSYERAKSLASLAFGDSNKFIHKEVGYNYRMTNIQAALGLAQMDEAEEIIEKRISVCARYKRNLIDQGYLRLPEIGKVGDTVNVGWMFHIDLLENGSEFRPKIMAILAEKGIETRVGFVPYDMQSYVSRANSRKGSCRMAMSKAFSSFYLPTFNELAHDQIDYVSESLMDALGQIYG